MNRSKFLPSIGSRVGVLAAACLLALALVSPAAGQATPVSVYNTFGGGMSYDVFSGFDVLGPGVDPFLTVDQTMGFVPSLSGVLSEITLAFEYVQGTNAVDMYLMTDAGGLPGSVLESWTFPAMTDPFFDPLITLTGDGTTTLLAGQPYWLVASAGAPDTRALWLWGENGVDGPVGSRIDGGPWDISDFTQGAFDVNVVVPEPATMALLAFGLVGAVAARRKTSRRG
jgi:hypothetical protein